MIVRCWSGRLPRDKADGFRDHLVATGVTDFRAQPGCIDAAIWRRDEGDWVIFTLVSTWRDMDSIVAHAGPDPNRAILYPGDAAFDLVPDTTVTHHQLIEHT